MALNLLTAGEYLRKLGITPTIDAVAAYSAGYARHSLGITQIRQQLGETQQQLAEATAELDRLEGIKAASHPPADLDVRYYPPSLDGQS
jgi:hypothetical protein